MQNVKMLGAEIFFAAALAMTGFGQTTTVLIDGFDPAGTGGNSYASGQVINVWTEWFW